MMSYNSKNQATPEVIEMTGLVSVSSPVSFDSNLLISIAIIISNAKSYT